MNNKLQEWPKENQKHRFRILKFTIKRKLIWIFRSIWRWCPQLIKKRKKILN